MARGFAKWASIRRLHDGSKRFELRFNLTYTSDAGSVYVTPKGFLTDLASIPRFLWTFFPPHGLYLSAAIQHDFHCEADWISRKEGDQLFLEAMRYSNVPDWKARIIYSAIRGYAILWRIK